MQLVGAKEIVQTLYNQRLCSDVSVQESALCSLSQFSNEVLDACDVPLTKEALIEVVKDAPSDSSAQKAIHIFIAKRLEFVEGEIIRASTSGGGPGASTGPCKAGMLSVKSL